ncbi:MAG TPA: VrrA/YqfQ family protein [Ureibacillus sp.]|nr:VrrA/YqfQ family protein [Ureibacillus sp.]
MRNFYRQGPPPMRPYHYYHGPGRMPNYGYPPPNRYNPGMIPPTGPKGASKIESFMETCNRLLATAQGFQPYIAQATPLIRNIPALWRLYKGFSSSPKGGDYEDDYENESSEFSLDSSSFEYVYKEDEHEHEHKPKTSMKHDHRHNDSYDEKHHDKSIRPKYESDYKEESNQKGAFHRFFPVRHERRGEPVRENRNEQVVEKLAKPYKTKPSIPKIYQPPYHFDE